MNDTTKIPVIRVETPEVDDPVVGADDSSNRPQIPQFLVLRAGSKAPDILWAQSRDEAWTTVERQVRTGRLQITYLYELVGAEAFTASSTRLTPAEALEGAVSNTTATAIRDAAFADSVIKAFKETNDGN